MFKLFFTLTTGKRVLSPETAKQANGPSNGTWVPPRGTNENISRRLLWIVMHSPHPLNNVKWFATIQIISIKVSNNTLR